MALQPRATLSSKGNGFITGKLLPHYDLEQLLIRTLCFCVCLIFTNAESKR